MKVLISVDSFKGTLSATDVCRILSRAATKHGVDVLTRPIADGGEGSLECLRDFLTGEMISVQASDPLGRQVTAEYYLSGDTAYIEMAKVNGLPAVEEALRNPLKETDFGTGELIADAIARGAKRVYLFCGGSATCSGGMGMAAALGYVFRDKNDNIISPIGENMSRVATIRYEGQTDLSTIDVTVLTDVKNPLYGPDGAAMVFAPQKGADPEQCKELDMGLVNLAQRLIECGYADVSKIAGGGAAGGIAAGCVALLNARIVSGIDWFIRLSEIERLLEDVDYLITGEGRLDSQTAGGKVMSGLLTLAQQKNVPTIALVGDYVGDKTQYIKMGFADVYRSRTPIRANFDEIKAHAAEDLYAAADTLFETLIGSENH